MGEIFQEVVYRPIFNLLVLIYNLVPGHDFGVAIVLLTVMVRLIFMPWSVRALRSQKKLAEIQPRIKELQEKFKHDKAAQAQATMAFYKENHINPLSGCLPLLVQLPFLFALYRAFLNGFKPESLSILYSFIDKPGMINSVSVGFLDLASKNVFLVVTAGVLQFIQSKMSLPKQTSSSKSVAGAGPDLASMNKQMLYFMPVMIIIIGWNLPAGLVLYWATTTLFSVFEQLWIKRSLSTK